jgi:hypothetical protein
MAEYEHLKILEQGTAAWNKWRDENPEIMPDLRGAALSGADLSSADLSGANLRGVDLRRANLGAAKLRHAFLSGADLSSAALIGADLSFADLSFADLSRAGLIYADIGVANLSGANLSGANFTEARMGHTSFENIDLSSVIGLGSVVHLSPSSIGIDTVYKSQGRIPDAFLLGCGVPESFIAQIPDLIGALEPIQFHSCFISYSSRDEEFAGRLHERMRREGLRVWYAPEEMKGGRMLREQVFRAIQVHDKLLLVLSEDSLRSDWVMTEIRRAKRTEVAEGRRKLFPIRVVGMEAIKEWECFDSDSGKDLAVEVRDYFIPDFSKWKEHDAFEAAFGRLLSDLKKAEEEEA